jgi:hypothetical protein
MSAFILCCSASFAALSGLPDDDELGASTGALATGELSWAIGSSDFLVPLAVDLAFGDMTMKRAKKRGSVWCSCSGTCSD